MSKIAYIIRPITNGMYNDTYTVYYTNGTRRRYTINGAMNRKHFEFIQSATVEAFYSKWTGAHKHDIFRPTPEAIEEPEEVAEEPAAVQEPEEETTETYSAWCGMIENDVITEEHETLSEAIDEVETKYTKEEQKALGVTYCRLLCTAGQWLECLEEKKIDDIYCFDKDRVIYDNRSGNYFRIDSELDEVRGAYWCTMIELDDMGDISAELSAGWMTKAEVNRCTDI